MPQPIMPPLRDDEILQRGHIVNVNFQIALPATASRSDVLEWVMLAIGFGSMAADNPLADYDIEALGEPLLSDGVRDKP